MDVKGRCLSAETLLLLGLCLPVAAGAGEWFRDPDTGCAVWGEHPQPLVTVHWSGDCVDGKASGKGLMEVIIDGIPFSQYEGEYRAGKAEGYGILISPDQSRYEGEFRDNIMHGRGVLISSDGQRLEGTFHKGLPHGKMILTRPDSTSRELEFEYGRRTR